VDGRVVERVRLERERERESCKARVNRVKLCSERIVCFPFFEADFVALRMHVFLGWFLRFFAKGGREGKRGKTERVTRKRERERQRKRDADTDNERER
jgi:hypothetical protein